MPLVQQCSTRNAETTYHAAEPAADPAARVKDTYSVGVFLDTLSRVQCVTFYQAASGTICRNCNGT